MSTANCGALLLAAGRSSRMAGGHKLLMPWQGKPLVAHAADAALAAELPLLVVLGHDANAVHNALSGRPAQFVLAQNHSLGLAHSLRAGLAEAPADWEALLVLLADMPRIEPSLLAKLAKTNGVAVPLWMGQRGNPVRWPRAQWPELIKLTGDRGARQLLAGLDVIEVPAPSDAVLVDIDTAESLAHLRST